MSVSQAGNSDAEEGETGSQQNNIQGRAVQGKNPGDGENVDSRKGSSGNRWG